VNRRGIGEHQLVELAEAVGDLAPVKPDPSVQTILDLGAIWLPRAFGFAT
jgi:hypothetical protein